MSCYITAKCAFLTNFSALGVVDGDCGSVIVNQQTFQVYGHVVATNPIGEAYVVPLENTFDQIKEALGAKKVALPSPKSLLAGLARQYYKYGYTRTARELKNIALSILEVTDLELDLDEAVMRKLLEEDANSKTTRGKYKTTKSRQEQDTFNEIRVRAESAMSAMEPDNPLLQAPRELSPSTNISTSNSAEIPPLSPMNPKKGNLNLFLERSFSTTSVFPPSPNLKKSQIDSESLATLIALSKTMPNATSSGKSQAKTGHVHLFLITGPTCSGKSTIAHYLAKNLNLPYIEGDEVPTSLLSTCMKSNTP